MHFSRCFACLEVDQGKMQQERALNPQKSRPGRSCRNPPIVSEPFFPPALCVSAAAQVFGIIFTIAQGKIIDRFGTLASNIFLCVFLVIGTIMTGEGETKFYFRHICFRPAVSWPLPSDEKRQKSPECGRRCCCCSEGKRSRLVCVRTENLFFMKAGRKSSAAGKKRF